MLFKKYPEVTRYTKQLFVHKLGSFVQFQTTPFLVYAFVSLKTVAYYGNYTLIIDKISIFISNLLGSTNAGVGNLIAEGDSKRIQQVFWELMGIRFLIAGTISFALIRLTGAFISLWYKDAVHDVVQRLDQHGDNHWQGHGDQQSLNGHGAHLIFL